MTDANDQTRKRDIVKQGVKQGFHKAVSKLGFSSQSQAEPSVFYSTMSSTAVAQAYTYNDPHYHAAPSWTNGGSSDDRANPNSGKSGNKGSVQQNRLDNSSSQGDDDKKKKKTKVEDNKTGTKDDSKKKRQ